MKNDTIDGREAMSADEAVVDEIGSGTVLRYKAT